MPFDHQTRNRLQRLVGDCRDLLTKEFDSKLQEIYGIYASEGRVLDLEKLPHLDDQRLRVAKLLRERIEYLAAAGRGTESAVTDAVRRLLREQAFTVLNRFVALRMAEERGIIVESVGAGFNSKAFKTFSEVAFSGLGDAYQRYRVFLFCLFDEMATDLGVLFDRASPYGLMFPREPVLLQLFDLLNAPDIESLWKEDETVGWIYQYFNDPSERRRMREESAAPRNSRELAVRNQFFTPRYVVEFLSDNTLGRVWYEMTQGQTRLREQCRYLVRSPNEILMKPGECAPESPKQDGLSQEELLKQPVHFPHRPVKDPRTILMLDPACGSMHFGLYAFDLFEVIYDEAWELEEKLGAGTLNRWPALKSLHDSYANKDAFLKDVPRLIIEYNIHGIDIDPRCAQIAGLSLWLRAQKTWQRLGVKTADRPVIKRSNIVCAEPMPGNKALLREFVEKEFSNGERSVFQRLLETIFEEMQLAGELGSLLKVEEGIRSAVAQARNQWEERRQEFFDPADLANLSRRDTQREFSALNAQAPALKLSDEQFWDTVESRIYDALRDYTEHAENGGEFQRRLFAEDAGRGFAFIDVCRKRYDVALMNPPFGVCSPDSIVYIRQKYPVAYIDLYTSFIDRGCWLLGTEGILGAITSRTGFFLSSFESWRRDRLLGETQLVHCIDLGQGVLDGAMVETAAYTIADGGKRRPMLFFDLAEAQDKQETLASILEAGSFGAFQRFVEEFLQTPSATMAYSMSKELAGDFRSLPSVNRVAQICRGSATSDDERFIRTIWEVPPEGLVASKTRRWRWLSKGGEFGAFYAPIHLALDWQNDGGSLGEFMYFKRPRNGHLWGPKSWSVEFIGKAGVVWPLRSQKGVSFRVMPADCAFSHKSPAVMSGDMDTDFALLAILNTERIQRLADCLTTFGSYEMGTIGSIPVDLSRKGQFTVLGKTGYNIVRRAFSLVETDPNHTPICRRAIPGLKELLAVFSTELSSLDAELVRVLVEANLAYREGSNQPDRRHEDAIVSIRDDLSCEAVLSEFVGYSFGRWDVRCATGEKAMPELSDPFAPLPVCPPGQLQNPQGLPANQGDLPASYPIPIPWDGILVDDPDHRLDIERRIREVVEIIWKDRAEAIEHEACEIVGVKSLRDYFRKPAGFFADHLKRYSKSRRQAPIYWPLSTASGSYTLWIYYHRLTDQTLFRCVNDFVKPKLAEVEADLSRLTGDGADKPGARAEIERLTTLRAELVEFCDELLRIAQLPYKPNLNDGVLITASPLWKLFHLPKWQKDLKACWEALSKGEYDWAHLALSIWPQRVKDACKKDRSIAIAHGLEELCDVKAPEKKAKKGRKKEQMELQEEST